MPWSVPLPHPTGFAHLTPAHPRQILPTPSGLTVMVVQSKILWSSTLFGMLAGGNRGHSSADLVKHNRQNWPSSLWSGRRSLLLLLLLNMIIIPNQPTKSAFDVPLLLCSPTPNTLHRGELPRTTPAGSCLKSEHRRRRPRRKFDHFFGANFTRRRRQSSFFLQLYTSVDRIWACDEDFDRPPLHSSHTLATTGKWSHAHQWGR